jgi:hypothetical protein
MPLWRNGCILADPCLVRLSCITLLGTSCTCLKYWQPAVAPEKWQWAPLHFYCLDISTFSLLLLANAQAIQADKGSGMLWRSWGRLRPVEAGWGRLRPVERQALGQSRSLRSRIRGGCTPGKWQVQRELCINILDILIKCRFDAASLFQGRTWQSSHVGQTEGPQSFAGSP